MRPFVLGALLLSALSVSADEMHDCYWRRLDQVVIKDNLGWFQCKNTQTTSGGAQTCCRNGDSCREDGICHTNDIGASQSAWYVGGCSDRTYNDPVCRQSCTQYKQTYIAWNSTGKLWDCCGDYHCESNHHANETFSAKSPAELEPIPQNGNFSPDDNDGVELSTAAKAGIGVGVGVVVIAIIGLIAFCCIRRRKPARGRQFNGGNKGTYAKLGPQHEMGAGPFAGPSGTGQRYESYTSQMPRSRDVSPAPASRGVSPSRSPLVSGYGNESAPTHAAAQSASMYPDKLAATRSTDDGA